MRARLHVRGGRIGFFREGTHDLCDASRTGQLLPATGQILNLLQTRLAREGAQAVREIELSENVAGTERALLVELAPGTRPRDVQRLPGSFDAEGVTGLVITRPEAPQFLAGRGHPHVSDVLEIARRRAEASVRLRRHVAAFFQGNRFLLQPLLETVLGRAPARRAPRPLRGRRPVRRLVRGARSRPRGRRRRRSPGRRRSCGECRGAGDGCARRAERGRDVPVTRTCRRHARRSSSIHRGRACPRRPPG